LIYIIYLLTLFLHQFNYCWWCNGQNFT